MTFRSRHATMMGMPAFNGDVAKVAQALTDMVPLRYTATLKDGWGITCRAKIITYLELDEWLDYKGYTLVSICVPPDLAMPRERTEFY